MKIYVRWVGNTLRPLVQWLIVVCACTILFVAAWREVMPTEDVSFWRRILGWTMTWSAASLWRYRERRTPHRAIR
jgi:hypothetical protein